MLITATVTVFWGGAIGITFPQVLANLTMVPNVFDQPMVDGVHWTLLHELVFYVLVFGLQLLGLGKRLDAFFPGWALLQVAVTFAAPNLSGIPLFGNFYAFFAGGAILATVLSI